MRPVQALLTWAYTWWAILGSNQYPTLLLTCGASALTCVDL